MKLKVLPRQGNKKSENSRLRREGFIPAVLYIKGKEGEAITVQSREFGALLRSVRSGHLPTTVFTLIDDKGRERRAIIKDIQYHVTTYNVLHLDFEELIAGEQVNIKVPIECVGAADCVGVKLGGVLRQVIRHVRVRCMPKDLPTFFELDVKDLGLKQSKRLADLAMPATVRPLADLNEVVAAIVKR